MPDIYCLVYDIIKESIHVELLIFCLGVYYPIEATGLISREWTKWNADTKLRTFGWSRTMTFLQAI